MALNDKEKETDSTIKQYFHDTQAVSRPAAVFFTLIIFFIGVAVILSLFWGGKWVYNRITDNKSNDTTITETSTQQTQKPNAENSDTGITVTSESGTTTEGSSSGSATTGATSTTTDNITPETGPSEVPNTGPQPE